MCKALHVLAFWLPVASLLMVIMREAEGATVKLRRGDDGGDDGDAGGGMGGLGGALASMFGAGGGGGDDGSNDDDANMVGEKKKGSAGGFDASKLENTLQTGGVGGLVGMLTAMRAASGNVDNHITKGTNGEDMYDFRDLDDGFTTPKPIDFHIDEKVTRPPDVTLVPMPALPVVSLPGKHGKLKISGMAAEPASSVVLPSLPTAPSAPVMTAVAAVPVPVATVGAAANNAIPNFPAASASGLYEGLALVRQNMDMLMNQLQGGSSGAFAGANGNDAALASKIDQLSKNFAVEEHKLEGKVEALEGENEKLNKQLKEQSDDINAMLGGRRPRATHKRSESNSDAMKTHPHTHTAHKSKGHPTKNITSLAIVRMEPGAYATKPWDVTFAVNMKGKAGGGESTFTVRVHPEWAPEGAKRFQDMVQEGILNDARFFRVIPKFMVQFGIPGSPKVAAKWMHKKIPDDPVTQSNSYGMISFAKSGRNSRTTQMFINTHVNAYLDEQGFAPFAEVLDPGMHVVERFQSRYRSRPNQGQIWKKGNKYLSKHFPGLSTINHVDVTPDATTKAAGFLSAKQ